MKKNFSLPKNLIIQNYTQISVVIEWKIAENYRSIQDFEMLEKLSPYT